MSEFTDKIKQKAEEFSAAVDNELTVLEGAGGADFLADDEDGETAEANATSDSGEGGAQRP